MEPNFFGRENNKVDDSHKQIKCNCPSYLGKEKSTKIQTDTQKLGCLQCLLRAKKTLNWYTQTSDSFSAVQSGYINAENGYQAR
jgi:hypothetical protein